MPVDKFGHTDVGTTTRIIAGGVTLSQVNNTFLRLDGASSATGDLNMNGNCIKGLPITNNPDAGMDEALSYGQAYDLVTNHDGIPSNDNHLTNKKYVDEQIALIVSRDEFFGPAFSAYSHAIQAFRIGAGVAFVNFPRVRFDPDNCFINLQRFFPKKAGCYMVSVFVEFHADTVRTSGNVSLIKTGRVYMKMPGGGGDFGGGGTAGANNNVSGTCLVRLTNTDYLEIAVIANAAVNIEAHDFSAAYLRP